MERLQELKQALARLPRVSLVERPTPLHSASRLSAALAGPEIWFKRDDLTGLAAGGNKSRMFEFVLAAASVQGADTVVAGAGVQSNYCRQLAAACARLGLECHLVLRRIRGGRDDEVQGGLLLDLLLGAHVEIVDSADWAEHGGRIRARAEELRGRDRKVAVLRVGCEEDLGLSACAYVEAAVELIEQLEAQRLGMDVLWVCSSDTTQAGLALGLKHLGYPAALHGISALAGAVDPERSIPASMARIANQAAELLEIDTRIEASEICNTLEYVGSGYGTVTAEGLEAMQLVARTEGILLDPVYTGKAMAGLIDHIRRGLMPAEQRVVFLHTGGLPALFAYADQLDLHVGDSGVRR
jgi:D-cysteine desulfhydrase family pyridoxal phosphate-dependent enzyme